MMEKIDLHNYEAFLLDFLEGRLTGEQTQALQAFVVLHPELGIDLQQEALPVIQPEAEQATFKNELYHEESPMDKSVFDYVEGVLPLHEKLAFEERLQLDAELRRQTDLFLKTRLVPDATVTMSSTSQMQKSEADWLNNLPAVAYFEKQLTEQEKHAFEAQLLHQPALRRELDVLKATVLKPNMQVVFEHKENLKRGGRLIPLFSNAALYRMAAGLLLIAGLLAVLFRTQPNHHIPLEHLSQQTKTKPAGSVSSPTTIANQEPANLFSAASIKDKLPTTVASAVNTPSTFASHTPSVNTSMPFTQQVDPLASTSPTLTNPNPAYKAPLPAESSNKVLASLSPNPVETIIQPMSSQVLNNQYLVINEEEDTEVEEPVKEKGFWKKVTSLAKQATKLGVKGLEVEESKGNHLFLSFNSLSIEKK